MLLRHQTPRDGPNWNPLYGQPSCEDVKIARSVEENSDARPSRWHRMVVFSDPIDAMTRAVISLYRTAITAAGVPSGARLYSRQVGRCHFLYFSPLASLLCARIFEVFPAEPIDGAPDLSSCLDTGLFEIRAQDSSLRILAKSMESGNG